MINSMTGFGRHVINDNKRQLTIEVKTVNHRYLDISFKIPRELYAYENQLKHLIQDELSRGRVDVYISIKGEGLKGKNIQVDWNLLNQYIEKISEIQAQSPIKGELTIDHLLSVEDIFYTGEEDEVDDQFLSMIERGLQSALQQVNEMRRVEGEALFADFSNRLEKLQHHTDHLKSLAEDGKKEHFDKLKEKLLHLMDDQEIDDVRLAQEAALLVDRADITEELTRLYSHIHQFSETIKLNDSVGRKLDFIAQELLREVNTIASKSNKPEISQTVVEMKSEIEKMKEQLQNVE